MIAYYLLELVQTLLELAAITRSQAGLLSLLVLAGGIVSAAPTARRLATVTFHLLSQSAVSIVPQRRSAAGRQTEWLELARRTRVG